VPFLSVTVKPGPTALAAALRLAGFNDKLYMPAVTDACGVHWPAPDRLQVALAVAAGESSGTAEAYHENADGSTDYGLMEINNKAHPEFFKSVTEPTQLIWSNYAQNAIMAWQVFEAAGYSFNPWVAYTAGGYLSERYENKSWMDWANYGVQQMNAGVIALEAKKYSYVEALNELASIDNDPLEYWT
jgi:hypothetical protein